MKFKRHYIHHQSLLDLRFALIILISLSMFSLNVFAQVDGIQYQWHESVNKNGVRVFSSSVPGSSFRAVKAEMLIEAKISSLVAMLEDIENCSNWASMCKQASLIKEISNDEYLVYILNEVTFPVADRDLIAHIKWSKHPSSGRLSMSSAAVSPYEDFPLKKGVVRLKKTLTQWHFTPKANGKVLVQSYAHIDPNGKVPAWLVNTLSKRAPYRSMVKVRKIIQSRVYEHTPTNLLLAKD